MSPAQQVTRTVRFSGGDGGFAMILTLVLVAFLLALLTALATLSRIEGEVADQAGQQAAARRHARLALSIALGQLQQQAGPDRRVTATAEAFGGEDGTRHYTGIWEAGSTGVAPLVWLVSGSEAAARTDLPTLSGPVIELLGKATSGVPRDVVAPLEKIMADPLPGRAGPVVVGHFAWWVGDEGVKASVAVAGVTDEITYPPFDSAELRRRLRPQLALGGGPADFSGDLVFEPLEPNNRRLLPKLTGFNQLEFLLSPGGTNRLERSVLMANFHAWTTRHRAVLADTKRGGLRQDLSLQPGLLGEAFAAWANYSTYMEDPAAPVSPVPSPAYPAGNPVESLRRRYRMTAPLVARGIMQGVAPVLSYFLLTFNVRTDQSVGGSIRPLEVRARWLASLWNPYASALVPEELQLEVTNLPTLQVVNDTTGTTLPAISLDALYGAPLRTVLPWIPAGRADQQSWLPGRVYTWAAKEDLNKGSPVPGAGFASVFYTRTLSSAAGQGVQRSIPAVTVANSAQAHLQGGTSQLTIALYRTTPAGTRERLGTFLSPVFSAFVTTPAPINQATYQITYVFHLAESTDTPGAPDTWLTTAGQDPRESVVPAESYWPGPNGPRPELYANYSAISFPDRLLDRALPAGSAGATGQSYNEDTPLFDLPRAPLLSVGALQHLRIPGARPFAIGNPWGDAGGWNALFDRYFFSGLSAEVTAAGLPAVVPLPNPLLRPARRKADGTWPTPVDLTAESATGYSSKFLLQDGGFNLNAVTPLAWLAVLRGGRFSPGETFPYLAATAATGMAGDWPATESFGANPVFFRFPFSAPETYLADAGYAASTSVPPAGPNVASPAATHLYRRGARALSSGQTVALANSIAALMQQRHASAGPFRSLEEFLAPSPLWAGRSLLEAAIAGAITSDGQALNDPARITEFSSQWLTQGDLMTALAPVLTVRSDTFRIRTYGEAVNPVTGQIEGRAWAEAVAQRMPDYVNPRQDAATAPVDLDAVNQRYGRRFKLISFQWLDPTDI
jgi:hypothetical protein